MTFGGGCAVDCRRRQISQRHRLLKDGRAVTDMGGRSISIQTSLCSFSGLLLSISLRSCNHFQIHRAHVLSCFEQLFLLSFDIRRFHLQGEFIPRNFTLDHISRATGVKIRLGAVLHRLPIVP